MTEYGIMNNRIPMDRVEPDERTRAYLTPKRIVSFTDLPKERVENAEALLENRPFQVSLHDGIPCTLQNRGGTASVLLDFGQEIHGGIALSVQRVTGNDSAVLRIRFGESVMETMSEIGREGNATNDHAPRDFLQTVQELTMVTAGETGFRFVKIDLISSDVSVSFHAIKAVLIYRDLKYLGSFSSSDPELNRIWEVGAYTVHLNMQQYIWDGIKRDRLVWIGDLHPEIRTIQVVFGDQELIQKSLDIVVSETPEGEWMNGIPSYSMWWIIIQHDYFMHSGNREYLEKQLPYMRQLIRMLSMHIGEDGRDTTPDMRFLDWPTSGDEEGVTLALQSLHVMALTSARTIFHLFGDEATVMQCDEDLAKMRRFPIRCTRSKQANAIAVLAGLLDPKSVIREENKKKDAAGISAFTGYYVLIAKAMAGAYEEAMNLIRSYWGGMIKLGATTFWEGFDLAWMKDGAPIDRIPAEYEIDVHGAYGGYCYKGYRKSLCHGWASGPTAWLSRYVLGIEILAPGCEKIRITPHLGDLSWAKGTFPTPYGIIEVQHRKQADGTVSTMVKKPEGVTIVEGGSDGEK